MDNKSEEEMVKEYGFDSLEEFHKLIARVELGDVDKMHAFQKWQTIDGTKEGLIILINPKEESE